MTKHIWSEEGETERQRERKRERERDREGETERKRERERERECEREEEKERERESARKRKRERERERERECVCVCECVRVCVCGWRGVQKGKYVLIGSLGSMCAWPVECKWFWECVPVGQSMQTWWVIAVFFGLVDMHVPLYFFVCAL